MVESEVGKGDCRGSISYSHQNSELGGKEDFTIHISPFRIPNSEFRIPHRPSIPTFQYLIWGVTPKFSRFLLKNPMAP
jgi:hypothetical protein